MKTDNFEDFFNNYSKNVDKAENLGFWKLSDRIILETVKKHIHPQENSIILDAGGGTGRWICKLSEEFSSKFILFDLSKAMLKQAEKNLENKGISKKVRIVRGNLTNMKKISSESVDYIISIYSPISFVNNTKKAFSELYRILKPKGKILIMGQGFYNAIFSKICNYKAQPEEISKLESEKKVKWNSSLNELNVYSKEILEKDLEKKGFEIINSYGIPVFVQPEFEDWDSENIKISSISKALESKKFFEKVLSLELKYNSSSSIINRGMNILTVAKK